LREAQRGKQKFTTSLFIFIFSRATFIVIPRAALLDAVENQTMSASLDCLKNLRGCTFPSIFHKRGKNINICSQRARSMTSENGMRL
jgi:hypothetical protein